MAEIEENVIIHAEDENVGAVEKTQKTVNKAGKFIFGALIATVAAELVSFRKKKK